MNEVRIDSASEEAHAISGLRSGKVLVDPHTDHKRCKDPLEERDDRPSPTIITEEDSEDEEAPDEESRAEPNPEVYKTPVPYPRFVLATIVAQSLRQRWLGLLQPTVHAAYERSPSSQPIGLMPFRLGTYSLPF